MSVDVTERMEMFARHLPAMLVELAQTLDQCFDASFVWTLGHAEAFEAVDWSRWQRPGLVVLFQIGELGAAVVLPESLPLPAWYKAPNDSQKARLGTLAMEWSLNLFPVEMEPSRSESLTATNLASYLRRSSPAPDAAALPIELKLPTGSSSQALLVWPLTLLHWDSAPLGEAAPAIDPTADDEVPAPTVPRDPLARLRKLPVTVSVRLTEKRISVSQLLAITPGALLTFNKSCDDLLDLYVNNSLYGRGEAVKIGECFGLKINEVGVRVERESKILQG